MRFLAFTGASGGAGDALGNECLVECVKGAPQTAPASAGTTICRTWSLGERSAGVRCWTPQSDEIQCCGHGLLSCAAWWVQQWRGDGHLMMGRSEIPCRQANGMSWLGFPRIRCKGSELPAWVTSHFGAAPIAAALAGPEDGYLILRWPDRFQLSQLRVPSAALGTHTRRAIIATCRDSGAATATVHLRYFAPQYGVVEDSATGSAMRILADYWAQTCQLEALYGQQDSARGGELFSRLEGDTAWVGGRVRAMDRADKG